jgi:hypothetical protein
MLVGYGSDESYAALADVALEFRAPGAAPVVVRSAPRGPSTPTCRPVIAKSA